MNDHETVPADGKGQALLTAIAELREAMGTLFDEQTELVLRRGDEPAVRPSAMEPELPLAPPSAPPTPPAVARVAPEPSPREPSEAGGGGDPRQRLDALARRLDKRWKPPTGSAPESVPRADGR